MRNFQFFIIGIICSAFKSNQAQVYNNNYDVYRHRSNYNYTTTASPTTIRNDNEMLNRIYNQMLTASSNDQIQNKKLENLENILHQFETRNQQELDSIHNEVKDFAKRIQNLDWVITRSDATLNQLKNDINELRHNLLSNKESNIGKRNDQQQFMMRSTSSPQDNDVSEKLEALATLLTSTRTAIHKIEKQTNTITNNVTNLLHTTRELSQRQLGLPTKQYLHSALNSLRSQSYYGLMQNHVGQLTPQNGPSFPASCAHATTTSNGIHKIRVSSTSEPFYTMCNNEYEDGGWTVIQNREDGSINFNRNWLEYKYGFGNLAGEFFIGLDKLYDMTSAMLHELLIVMEDFEGIRKIAKYKQFAIAGEKEDYALRILGEYEGDAGDSLSYSASYKFSTFDNDNDGWVEGNCALAHTGAWWYNACEMSNLNGQYLGGEVSDSHQFQGIYWNEFRGPKYSLKSVKMLIRPIERIFLPNLN